MAKEIRTRFAPSPTGHMHIGNLRTALYEYLVARANSGNFILRIEDTDQKRYMEGAVDVIYGTLKLAGIRHDEGPDVGGDYGPYIQSQRKHIYIEYAEKLIETGKAYYCFCPKENTDSHKDRQDLVNIKKKACPCVLLSESEAGRRTGAGEPYVIRQKMPRTGYTTIEDSVFGKITVDNSELEDQVLIKSDMLPTYNFANVIDDHLMKITHIVRGSEFLTSTPKYKLLYEAFGWELPTYIHLPLIMKKDGGKLSKREGDPSFEDLVKMGYLPEAIVNFVALLGWSPGEEREFFTLEELEKVFSIDGISKSPSVFDMEKLKWMNGEYIRRKTPQEFHKLALPYYEGVMDGSCTDLEKVSAVLQKRTEILGEIPGNIDFLNSMPEFDISMYRHKKMKTDEHKAVASLKAALAELKGIDEWKADIIHSRMLSLAAKLEIKNGQLLWPLRVAITGKQVTPGGAIEIADILGKHETLERLENSISILEKELKNS